MSENLPARREAEVEVASSVIRSVDDLGRVAKMAAASGYFKDKNTPQKAGAAMALAQAMGFAPVIGLTSIDIIDGKPSPSAQLLAAAIDRHPDYDYQAVESSTTTATIAFSRRDPVSGEWRERGRVTWTMEDAKRAGLEGKQNWKRHPRPMLFWRAMTEGARLYCPGILEGAPFYMPDELGADAGPPAMEHVDVQTGEIIDVEPSDERTDLEQAADEVIDSRMGPPREPDDPQPEAPLPGQTTLGRGL